MNEHFIIPLTVITLRGRQKRNTEQNIKYKNAKINRLQLQNIISHKYF